MSLRMNLYGFSLVEFHRALGSCNDAVLQSASSMFEESQNDEEASNRGKAWLQTLVMQNFPLRSEGQPAIPLDGGLLTMKMETETHAFVVYSLVRSVAANQGLDLSADSSNWAHPAITMLQNQLSASHFSRSSECPTEYHALISKLVSGSPIFGDDFRTAWSFYSILTNEELTLFMQILAVAIHYVRKLPKEMPVEVRNRYTTELSQDSKEFAQDLVNWFGQIQKAGQDAFIMWW